MRQVAAERLLPLFGALKSTEVYSKGSGDIVTRADIESEQALARQLQLLLPQALIVGEELTAQAADPEPDLSSGYVWLIDPLDGTRNFAAGDERFAVMVALLHRGEPIQGWILNPLTDTAIVAEHGAGAYCYDSAGASRPLLLSDSDRLQRGFGGLRALPDAIQLRIREQAAELGLFFDSYRCVGLEFMDLATSEAGFSIYGRTLPWDHAPGSLIYTEAGGVMACFDGSPYQVRWGMHGLVSAATPRLLDRVQSLVTKIDKIIRPFVRTGSQQ